jgi:hypothetical protein
MFKNIEVLDKEKFKSVKFTDVDTLEVAKNIGIMPIGFSEVIQMSCTCPIVIMGDEHNLEFIAFTGISKSVNVFNQQVAYLPIFPQTYPFVNMYVKDEDDKLKSVIGIDNGRFVAKRKKHYIFNKDKEVQELANNKIKKLIELNRQREVSKNIIAMFKKYDLLLEKNFSVKFEEEEKTLLEKFYIINREKLVEMDDEFIATIAKKGWMSIVDCHIKSLSNFQKVITSTQK